MFQNSLMESNSKKIFWDLKPYWCQPWSIILFGITLAIISLTLFNNLIITSILSFFIIIWWIVFLIIVPNLYQEISDNK